MNSGPSWWVRCMPVVFIPLWSTGFIVARFGMPHAPPLSFLCARYLLSVLCFGLWVFVAKLRWPANRRQWGHLAVTGALVHGGYLGGVWVAVKQGMGAGTIALIVGLQPVLTALWLTRQSTEASTSAIGRRHWAGLLLGLLGLWLVLQDKLGHGEVHPLNLSFGLLALLSITAGTLYQKQYVAPCDVRTANTVQLGAALLVTAPFVFFEPQDWTPTPELYLALAWSVLGLTVGASSLLFLMIQRGAAERVSSLMYLVPPCTAVMAWLLFDEPVTGGMMVGMACIAVAVSLVLHRPSKRTRP